MQRSVPVDALECDGLRAAWRRVRDTQEPAAT
jgi:hypothetical protein